MNYLNDVTLKLETRKKIYETIQKQPGICVRELERELNITMGQLTYHLLILLKAGLIKEESDNYFRRFYPVGLVLDTKLLNLFKRNSTKDVVVFLLNGRKTNKELSKKLRISPSAISWHIKFLEKHKLLNKERVGKKVYYSLKDRDSILKNLKEFNTCSKRYKKGSNIPDSRV